MSIHFSKPLGQGEQDISKHWSEKRDLKYPDRILSPPPISLSPNMISGEFKRLFVNQGRVWRGENVSLSAGILKNG